MGALLTVSLLGCGTTIIVEGSGGSPASTTGTAVGGSGGSGGAGSATIATSNGTSVTGSTASTGGSSFTTNTGTGAVMATAASSTSGTGATTGNGGSTSFTPPKAISAIAAPNNPYHCGSAAPCPTGSLILILGAPTPACDEPDPVLACGPSEAYFVFIGIPESMAKVGTIALSDPAITASFRASQAGGSNVCNGASGSLSAGTLTIDDIGASSVSFGLSGTSLAGPTSTSSIDGSYLAPICE